MYGWNLKRESVKKNEVYKRFRKLIEKWIDMAVEHVQFKVKQANSLKRLKEYSETVNIRLIRILIGDSIMFVCSLSM